MAEGTFINPVGIRDTRPNSRPDYIDNLSCTYVQIGKLVVFSLSYTTKTDISNVVNGVVQNMPIALYPVKVLAGNNNSTTSYESSDRYVLVSGSSIGVFGSHTAGVVYSASGAYITT